MDTVTAFSNGILVDELYLEQPKVFGVPAKERKVFKMNKSMYGLKQSLKIWKDQVQECSVSSGFHQSEMDICTYIVSDVESDNT